jgi:DNA-binding transcriptional regulator YdaS (Cro superfamily)
MNLHEYFEDKPRGHKTEFARKLGITKTWMSLLISGRQIPSPALCILIERHTQGKVKREELRPDIFGDTYHALV